MSPTQLWMQYAGEVCNGLGVALLLGRYLAPPMEKGSGSEILKGIAFFSLFVAARTWLALVSSYVPEPYLASPVFRPRSSTWSLTAEQDEVFHIPQAQTYCQGRFWDWDDKITTPPGL
jgi:alpha-1,2-glucosyltransferase